MTRVMVKRFHEGDPCLAGCGAAGKRLYLGYCEECANEALFTIEGQPKRQYETRIWRETKRMLRERSDA